VSLTTLFSRSSQPVHLGLILIVSSYLSSPRIQHILLCKPSDLWETLAAAANHAVSPLLPPKIATAHIHTAFAVQGRRSQSYEPLLLETEREAVADLLQYLESTLLLRSGGYNRLKPFQTAPPPTSSQGNHSLR
jgi:hypothetical protein